MQTLAAATRTPAALADVDEIVREELQSIATTPDPYPTYARMRQNWPVAELFSGVSFFRYADADAVLRHPRVGSDDRRSETYEQLRSEQKLAPSYLSQLDTRSFLHRDPPEHTRLRRLVSQALTPSRVEALRTAIEAMVNDRLDAASGSGQIELIAELAYPLPIAVISALIGVPPEDRPLVASWPRVQLCCSFKWEGQKMVQATAAARRQNSCCADPGEADSIQQELTEYFDGLIALRRTHPGNDLVSALIAAGESGDRLSKDELNATLRLLFVAGYETTVNLIGNGALALLRHPDQLQALRENLSLAANAVEETIRYDAPFQFTSRIALDDLDISGYQIPRGTTMMIWLAAANRDPERFSDPDCFDITRANIHHLGFGSGIHACLGAPLARMQGVAVFRALARRFVEPRLQLDPPPYRGDVFRAMAELPVTFRDLVPAA